MKDAEKVKDSTRDRLLELQTKYGIEKAILVAKKSLKVSTNDGDFKRNFNGEICEVVLEMRLTELVQKHKDWFYVKGLILPDAEKTYTGFLTEIDFVLFTPQCIYCIECKSFSGKKVLSKEGTITIGNKSRDVYKQNAMHLETLDKLISNFTLNKQKPKYQMVLFDFSHGDFSDNRSEKWKKIFPLIQENTINRMFVSDKKIVWDIIGLQKAKLKLEAFSEKTRGAHLKYVKGLHGK